MKMFVVFVILLHVSQHALAVLVEVNEGERSVLLSCLYSGSIPEDNTTVMWTCSGIDPKSVHLRRAGGDDLRGQNQRYRGRTSMNRYALITKDFSLTLRKPQLTDSGNYTCSISNGRQERSIRAIKLQVKDQQVEVKVREGSQSVILPCKTTPDLPEDTTVEWTRSDFGLITVHEYSNRNDELMTQDEVYRDRTKMSEDLLRTGDLSLTLKYPTVRDTGGYICTIYRDKDILTKKVVLQVKDYQVEVDSGAESVKLPCITIFGFIKVAKVEWKDKNNRKVHVYENGSDQPHEQHQFYRGRTNLNRKLLKPGDLSLTLKNPTDGDNSTYTCTVYSSKGTILRKKKVLLDVKVPQVEVDSGEEFVLLPCKTTKNLPEVAKVEWMTRYNRKVHMYENGSDQLEEQDYRYRDRTKINEDLLRTGDLSLTLKHPSDDDTSTYTCIVYNREGNILLKKEVMLDVRVPQVEVVSGEESVHLPFKTTINVPEDAKVEWMTRYNRKVHMYENGSDQLEDQDHRYRDRTKINEDLLRTGDLSLTLKHPTDWDTDTYTCTVYSREGKKILMMKQVELKVKVCQVEVEEGAESIELPFKTTENLPEDAEVVWRDSDDKKVHVFKNGSELPKEQHQVYKDRTMIKKDLLKTGDLSLTLKTPTQRDRGGYSCTVYGTIKRYKRVLLRVRVCQVDVAVEEGVESIELPFKTTENLPEDAEVVWRDSDDKKVHVYKNGSDHLEEQHHDYKDRTKMDEELLRTGNLSLTLKHPTVRDSGVYRCEVYGNIQRYKRYKRVLLRVRGRVQVQDQTGDIRNRSSSIDPTPLMADQSV